MKAIILCAGKCDRLKPLTDDLPKPMVPINSKPNLEYLILLCKKHGINEIAINTSYLPHKIKEYFINGDKFGVKLRYSFEPKLLGTSGALNNFRDFFDETFFVIYGDNLTDINLSEMLRYHKDKRGLGTLYLHKQEIITEKTTPGIVLFDKNYKITEIIEKPNEFERAKLKKISERKKLSNSGIYILEPEILKLIPEGFSDFANNIFPKVINSGYSLYGFISKYYFKEIGEINRYLSAREDIELKRVKLNI